MATSQNGYSANDRSVIASFLIPGTERKVALRKGDCAVCLLDFLAWFDKEIESIDGGQLDDWGYAERPIRGSTTVLSNHASGTGVDINALLHGLGKRGTFTPEQTAKIRAKLATYDGVLRWGGDYVNRADEMHVEINKGAVAVKVVADRIRAAGGPGAGQPSVPSALPQPPASPSGDDMDRLPVIRLGATGQAVRNLQGLLLAAGRTVTVDGDFGPNTDKILRAWQTAARAPGGADGIAGPGTWGRLLGLR